MAILRQLSVCLQFVNMKPDPVLHQPDRGSGTKRSTPNATIKLKAPYIPSLVQNSEFRPVPVNSYMILTFNHNTRFALCIDNADCDDLEQRKVYPVIPDAEAQKSGYIRVIDESGEDYLYLASCFVPVDIPQSAQEVFSKLLDRS